MNVNNLESNCGHSVLALIFNSSNDSRKRFEPMPCSQAEVSFTLLYEPLTSHFKYHLQILLSLGRKQKLFDLKKLILSYA